MSLLSRRRNMQGILYRDKLELEILCNGSPNDTSDNAYGVSNTNATLTTDKDSNPNSAYEFLAANSARMLVSANIFPRLGSMSICYWVYGYNYGSVRRHYTAGGFDSTPGISIRINGAGDLAMALKDGTNTVDIVAGAIALNTWHYVCGVVDRDVNTMSLYVNDMGTPAITGDISVFSGVDINGSSNPLLGTKNLVQEFHDGKLDAIRVWSKAISPDIRNYSKQNT